jgi:copper(I)-binding protein
VVDKVKLGALAIVTIVVIAGTVLAYTTLGSVTVEGTYYTETPRAIGVFGKIHNGKLREVCLIKVELAEPRMAMVELHETIVREGVHEMRKAEKLCIPPRGALELKPAGYHVMIMGSSENLKAITADKIVALKLVFDDGTQIEIKAKPAEQTEAHSHNHHS